MRQTRKETTSLYLMVRFSGASKKRRTSNAMELKLTNRTDRSNWNTNQTSG